MTCSFASAFLRLQLVIAVLLTGLTQAGPATDGGPNRLFGLTDARGDIDHLGHPSGRDADDAVGIADQEVGRLHARRAERDWHVIALDPDPVLPGAHPPGPRVDGVTELDGAVRVAADAVDDRAAESPLVRGRGEQVSPHGRVQAA